MFSRTPDLHQRPTWARYGVAVASVFLGWFAREAITPSIGPSALPFIFFFPAVAIAAWYGGLWPGVLSIVISAIGANWFFIEPIRGWALHTWNDFATMVSFVLASSFIVGSIEAMYRARARAQAAGRKREAVEQEIRQEQRKSHEVAEQLAAVVEHSGDVMVTKDLNGIIRTWNASAERLFGYRAEEIIGKHVTVLFPPDRYTEEDYILARLREGQLVERLETIRVAKNGRHIPVAVSISPLKDAEGKIVGASKIIHDITDLVTAREALTHEKELLATTLASIGDAVIVTDPEGRITFLNAEAERLTKWTNSEATGRPLPEIFRIRNEDTSLPVENPVEKVLRCGSVVGLANHTILTAKDGSEISIDDSAAPIRHSGGPLLGIVLVFRDFTERKLAEKELREAHEQLADRAGQLETLVQERTIRLQDVVNELQHVSYAMAHDMRAPLRAMTTFASLLAENASAANAPADSREYTRRIIVAAKRLDKLIQDALHYTKVAQQDVSLSPVDLTKLVRDLIDTYPNFHSDKADILIVDKLPAVFGNDSLLTQCFSNLLGNAVKFVAPGVKPKIRVRAEVSNGAAKIWIQDNGIGIPKNSQGRLFQMFQKLDAEYEGTGIGLAIVRKVVERMGGKVGVESEPGTGSNFWVELPLANGRNKVKGNT